VIEDLDCAAPSRRRHAVALSATIAAVSLALLVVLLTPPAPFSAPSPSPRASVVVMVRPNPLTNLPLDLTRSSVCPDGSFLTPPYVLTVEASTGRILAGVFDGNRIPHFVTLNVDAGTGKVTVTCATEPAITPDVFDQTRTWEFDVR
jgi:hypothetical protein